MYYIPYTCVMFLNWKFLGLLLRQMAADTDLSQYNVIVIDEVPIF